MVGVSWYVLFSVLLWRLWKRWNQHVFANGLGCFGDVVKESLSWAKNIMVASLGDWAGGLWIFQVVLLRPGVSYVIRLAIRS
ncbi:hypothetical protein GOBAR_DD05104 [Gossypium barbadense]|nr:hypothetical protein GOBAR_DD05104 [Gossypium barbadense]